MILGYSGENFRDFMRNLERFLNEIRNNAENLSDDKALKFVGVLQKIVILYKNGRLKNIDFSQLEGSKKVGYPADIQTYVNDILDGSYDVDNPNYLLEVIIILFFADLYELELSNLNREESSREISDFNQAALQVMYYFSTNNLHLMTRLSLIICNLCIRKYTTSESMVKIESLIKDIDTFGELTLEVEQKVQEVTRLKENLEKQKNEYNFIGLSKAFHQMKRMKKIELKSEQKYNIFLRVVIAILLSLKLSYAIFGNVNEFDAKFAFISLSSIFLIAVLIYFFRISLINIKSIKSQILQLDLRLSLCQFIHNYSTESKDMRDNMKDSLEKFESIIFSPIVANEEQIPTTFDNLDQFIKMMNVANGGKVE